MVRVPQCSRTIPGFTTNCIMTLGWYRVYEGSVGASTTIAGFNANCIMTTGLYRVYKGSVGL